MRLKEVHNQEGRYLLGTNLTSKDPVMIWQAKVQLSQVEEAFRTLKGDLSLRPIYHQRTDRIEAHLPVAFLVYCLSMSLRQQPKRVDGGLNARAVLEKLATLQMLDVPVPTTDGRELLLIRRTETNKDAARLIIHLGLNLPLQISRKIQAYKPTPMWWRPLESRTPLQDGLAKSPHQNYPVAEVGPTRTSPQRQRAVATFE